MGDSKKQNRNSRDLKGENTLKQKISDKKDPEKSTKGSKGKGSSLKLEDEEKALKGGDLKVLSKTTKIKISGKAEGNKLNTKAKGKKKKSKKKKKTVKA